MPCKLRAVGSIPFLDWMFFFLFFPPLLTFLVAVQLTFDFDCFANISKELPGYDDCSGPRILEIGPVVQKLSRFSQVQSEHERTLIEFLIMSKVSKEMLMEGSFVSTTDYT